MIRLLLSVVLNGVLLSTTLAAEHSVALKELRSYSTMHSIGIEWDIEGDEDHDASCSVSYRVLGRGEWSEALPLIRVDYRWQFEGRQAEATANMFAGSILFLRPGAFYEVRLEAHDPDGGQAIKNVHVFTRPLPAVPTNARLRHVIPDAGRAAGITDSLVGDGSPESPFRGVVAAQKAAEPGDVFLLHAGRYGRFSMDRGGEAIGMTMRPIVWRAAGDGDVEFERIDVSADYVWLESLSLKSAVESTALKAGRSAAGVVVLRNKFSGYHNSVMLSAGCRDWYVADNVIVGDNDPLLKHPAGQDGEGIELGDSSGHTICHNSISRVADGFSYPGANCDIFGNDIFDVSDDALEPDHGLANVRMWENRLTNYQFVGVSFQPMRCGPWYLVRNQFVGRGEPFKFYGQDRFVAVNNTFVFWGSQSRAQYVLKSFSRNNLYVSLGGRAPIWNASGPRPETDFPDDYRPDWKTDLDYDGFATDAPSPMFRWGERTFDDLKSISTVLGIELHGVRLPTDHLFQHFSLPQSRTAVPRENLILQPNSAAVDAGVVVPNLAERFVAKAPDLGAHESGQTQLEYGPRRAE